MTTDSLLANVRNALGIADTRALVRVGGDDEWPILALEIGPETYRDARDGHVRRNASRWLEFQFDQQDDLVVAPRGQRLRMPHEAFFRIAEGILAASKHICIQWVVVHGERNEVQAGGPPLGWEALVVGVEDTPDTIRDRAISFGVYADKECRDPKLIPAPAGFQVCRAFVARHGMAATPAGFHEAWLLRTDANAHQGTTIDLPPLDYRDYGLIGDAWASLPARSSQGHDYLVAVPAEYPPLATISPLCGCDGREETSR